MARSNSAAAALLVAVVSFLPSAAAPTPAEACATVYMDAAAVAIASEEALIVWDAAAGVEHFIRRANFRTDADDFGFLVPTPSPPQLSEVDGAVFGRINTHIAPPVEYRHGWQPVTCCTAPFLMVMSGAERAPTEVMATSGVEVLSTAEVAGMDATVVRADDAEVLAAWLAERGYVNRPALVTWLAPYVRDGFAVTAFRYLKSETGDPGLRSRAVRMSFETDRPFYPYREPSDHPEEFGRMLRVHVVATERAFPSAGADGQWSGQVRFAAPLDAAATLLGDAGSDVAGPLWLTSYVDTVPIREDGDLRFDLRADEEFLPEPIVRQGGTRMLPLPIEPVVMLGGGVWWWRRRKRRDGSG